MLAFGCCRLKSIKSCTRSAVSGVDGLPAKSDRRSFPFRRFLSMGFGGRPKTNGRAQRWLSRRRYWSRSHILRTREHSAGSTRRQHQVEHHGVGRCAGLRDSLIADSMGTRARHQPPQGSHVLEGQRRSLAALAAHRRHRSATCTHQSNQSTRSVERAIYAYGSEPRDHWLGLPSRR